ncbi:hypothetical protein [Mesobacillus maritimus]|uniref:N-acetyltransferase domain-containing protein n=1 Tax=Mesobacillus maritimus TaxID=1643336 RepID=A0ABS7KBM3_9BACI|nr:hypothetical protein [Mesobacillus maritimus]MBY0099638.1 hypothetical protein [Mesobacillus maritimus]
MNVYVDNHVKREEFMNVWGDIAKERKYQVTDLNENAEAFILKSKDGTSVGTIEFVPCGEKRLDLDDLVDISNETRILNDLQHSYQVRKMGVKREFATKTILLDLLKLAAMHAKNNQVRYYVSFLEKHHYHKLTEKFKFRIEKVGEDVKMGKKTFVPAFIDVEDAITNTQGYPIYIKSVAYLVQGTKKVKAFFA